MVMALVQTINREINQLQQNVRALLDPVAVIVLGSQVAPVLFKGAATVSASVFVDDPGTLTVQPGAWDLIVCPTLKSTWVIGQGDYQVAVRVGIKVIQAFDWSPPVSSVATVSPSPVTMIIPVNITVPTTYKLSIRCNGPSSSSIGAIMADGSVPNSGFTTSSYWYARRAI